MAPIYSHTSNVFKLRLEFLRGELLAEVTDRPLALPPCHWRINDTLKVEFAGSCFVGYDHVAPMLPSPTQRVVGFKCLSAQPQIDIYRYIRKSIAIPRTGRSSMSYTPNEKGKLTNLLFKMHTFVAKPGRLTCTAPYAHSPSLMRITCFVHTGRHRCMSNACHTTWRHRGSQGRRTSCGCVSASE